MGNSGAENPQYGGFHVRSGAVILHSVILINITFLAVQLLYKQGHLA